MAGDLLNLATVGINRVQDLPENLQWIFVTTALAQQSLLPSSEFSESK